MVYKFTLISDEVDDFIREIKIDSDATFYDFHKIILSCVGYKDDQMTSFFICDEDWERRVEITLEDMSSSSDEDTWVMDRTKLSELIEDEGQRLVYIFDQLTERSFAIELTETFPGQDLKKPVCTAKHGDAPAQTVDFDDAMNNVSATPDFGEDFYGDEGYNDDELDSESYGINEGENASIDPDAY